MDGISRSSKKITTTLFVVQSIASAGMIAIGTLNTIVGAELSGKPGWAGIPAAVYLVAGALAAFLWGRLIGRIGWRIGLTTGLVFGLMGSALVVAAIQMGSWVVLMFAMVLIGVAYAAMNLSRFAAAEVNPPSSRGKAISTVVLGGTVGAIVGPLMVGPAGRMAVGFGADELGGAYMMGAVLFSLAATVVFLSLKPDPGEIGRDIARLFPTQIVLDGERRPITEILKQPAAMLAVLAMVFGQTVMVLLMVITTLHMRNYQHGLGSISLVISAHTFGMFAFSIISGRLADRFGRGPVIAFGAGTLVLASLVAQSSTEVLPLMIALFLLGLGWNFCYVGGSALLADQLSPAERSPTQGFNDLLVGMVSALGSLGSGIVYASLGYRVMSFVGAAVSLVLFGVVVVWLRGQRRAVLRQAV